MDTFISKREAMLVGRLRIPSYNLCTTGCTTVSGNEPGLWIQPKWQVQCDPISTRGFITMLSSRMVRKLRKPDLRWKGESENPLNAIKNCWRQFFQFTHILGVMIWLSPSGLTVICLRIKIQAMPGLIPSMDFSDGPMVTYIRITDARRWLQ